jgi:hypothetical protein
MIDVNIVRDLYNDGKSQTDIAHKLKCSRSYIDAIMRKNGILARSFSDASNKFNITSELGLKLNQLYNSGLPVVSVANIVKVPVKAVRRYLKGRLRSKAVTNRLWTVRRAHNLSQKQLNVIFGTLLGDASLSLDGDSIVYSVSHCNRQHGYIDYTHEIIGHGSMSKIIQKSGFAPGSIYYHFVYRNKGALSKIWDKVMRNGKKKVNLEWLNNITPEALAYWFMDDGSSVWVGRKKNYVRISFATYSFDKYEVELLSKLLANFCLHSKVYHSKRKNHGKGFSIVISQSDSNKFMNLVSPTVQNIPCMQYKIKRPRYSNSFRHRVCNHSSCLSALCIP